MDENWLPVRGFETTYQVSNFGNVRRSSAGKGTRGAFYQLKPLREKGGYLHVGLSQDGIQKPYKIHKLVMQAFVGPCPDGYQINHKDGCPTNNALSNLEYCTPGENILHSFRVLNRRPNYTTGTKNGRAKLTEDQVRDIRRRYAEGGISQQLLADEYGVNQTMIGFIVRRVSWPHLED